MATRFDGDIIDGMNSSSGDILSDMRYEVVRMLHDRDFNLFFDSHTK